jgi:ribosome-associated protein
MSDIVINERITIPAAELQIGFARSSGPGGQNVNKVETKVEVRWNPGDSGVLSEADRAWLLDKLSTKLTRLGELIVTSERTRDQSRNKQDALDKLGQLVREALVRPKPRKKTRPSKGARERRLAEKKRLSERKKQRRVPPDDH